MPSGACGTITLPSGSTLSASAGSAGTPVGIAPDSKAASCEFKLSGPQQSGPQPVTLQYSSDVLGGLPATRVSVFRLRGDGSWTFLPSLVDAKAGTVTASVSGPETLVALADLQAFPDVPSGYWAKDAIDVAAGAELVDGFPPPFDGLYQPGGPITRAQAAKMVVVDAQLLPQSGPTPFTDVHASDWYAPYIAAGYQAGILDGLTPTTFGPDQPVTREQFAVMLARALKLSGTATLTYADAAAIDGWARAGVEAVVAAGYFDGMPGNMFQPHAVLTRAQAAQAMARVVQRQAPSGQP